MDNNFILYLGRHTLETAVLLSAPVLITCMVVGIVITILQAVTSIRDMTLTIVPKLLAVGVVMLVFGNWMLQVTMRFTSEIFMQIQNVMH
jgi:flagellar biosynthesis protein FliQ